MAAAEEVAAEVEAEVEREDSAFWQRVWARTTARPWASCKVTSEEFLSGAKNLNNTAKQDQSKNVSRPRTFVKMEQTYQYGGSWVNGRLWCPVWLLLLSLLLQPFLPLAVLVPGQDPCHAHPGTRKVELVAQFDQSVVFPQNFHHFHLYL